MSKNNAPAVIKKMLKRMAIIAMVNKGGGVVPVDVLLVGEISNVNESGSRSGLSAGW